MVFYLPLDQKELAAIPRITETNGKRSISIPKKPYMEFPYRIISWAFRHMQEKSIRFRLKQYFEPSVEKISFSPDGSKTQVGNKIQIPIFNGVS